jgi:hypothetical protein
MRRSVGKDGDGRMEQLQAVMILLGHSTPAVDSNEDGIEREFESEAGEG